MALFKPDATAAAIAELFALCPDEWEDTGYRARHISGLDVWIANGWTGVHIESPSRILPLGMLSQIHVWRAYRRWKKPQPVEPHPAAALAQTALAACRAHSTRR